MNSNLPKSFYPPNTGGHESVILDILKKVNCQKYLELGIYKGSIISVASKFVNKTVGVDIIDHIGSNKNFDFINSTTDDFFNENKENFDVIFIDADHKYESCVKDFENSLKILNYNGFIFIHDTDPISNKYTDFGYCGDSYKINKYIYENHQELDIITLPLTEAGLTIVKRKNENRFNLFKSKPKKIILVNDYLHGLMGERVLWDFMLEGIPNLVKVDLHVLKTKPEINTLNISFEQKVSLYIEKYHSDYKAIIQNGSWFGLIPSSKPRIALIQDNLRKMSRRSHIQEYNFKNAEYIITPSSQVDEYYKERNTFQIPIGLDSKMFLPKNKFEMRKKYKIDAIKYKKIGIFVGAMNEVKGWSRILNIIDTHQDIYWIIVSKHKEYLQRTNTIVYNKIDQNKLCDLHNCADFFIIGSPSECQCLAAIESCLCNIPIIMRNTGFVTNLTEQEKKQIGYIGENLEEYVEMIKHKAQTFIPREIVMKYYSIDDMCKKWIKFLNSI